MLRGIMTFIEYHFTFKKKKEKENSRSCHTFRQICFAHFRCMTLEGGGGNGEKGGREREKGRGEGIAEVG